MHPTSSPVVALGMIAVTLLVVTALVVGYGVATARRPVVFGIALAMWVALVGAAAASGVLRDAHARPPPIVVVVLGGMLLAVVAARSSIGERLARGLPLAALVGFHCFRLPLELVMHRAASEGTMPVQMSFSGWNFDIVSGASAIVVAWMIARDRAPRWLVVAWAVMSTALLGVIIAVAVASTPIFAAFGTAPERLNTWIGWFPFSWLPAVLVPAALFGQLVVFRRLATDRVSAALPARSARSRA
ncbi:MAG: hypothetical protein JWP87_5918 [Labilithrix sp.]|nr:hypothetical protein [Labilithrix sp.]